MRPENKRMQEFLKANGITAIPKYIPDGSLKFTWRLYDRKAAFTPELADKLNSLGFVNYSGQPLSATCGNGGRFSVFVRGHYEMLDEQLAGRLPKVMHRPTVRIAKSEAPTTPIPSHFNLLAAMTVCEVLARNSQKQIND